MRARSSGRVGISSSRGGAGLRSRDNGKRTSATLSSAAHPADSAASKEDPEVK